MDGLTPMERKLLRAIPAFMGEHKTFNLAAVVEFFDGSRSKAQWHLSQLVRKGHVVRCGWGVYRYPNLWDRLKGWFA